VFPVGFEVLNAMAVDSSLYRVITPWRALKVSLHFGGTNCFYLHDGRVSKSLWSRQQT
jgi:hypothetical protein